MSLNLEQKKAVVAEVAGVLPQAEAAILADYRGLTVAQMTQLRARAREAQVYIRVVKNTLARRALTGTPFECLVDHLSEPVALVVSQDPVAAAKLLDGFAKEHEALQIKVGSISGKVLSSAEIAALAKLPGRQELLAQLVATLQAPIRRFVQTLHEVPARCVRTLAAVRDAKGSE